MRRLMLSAAAAALLAAPVAAGAADYTFALVPKNVNNPFFDQARDGCKKAEEELGGEIECRYIGPGEHGGGEEQLQMVNDLIQSGIDGLAVSPSNAAILASALTQAKAAGIPVLTWDSDLLPENADLRIAYVGTKNYDIGVNLAKIVQEIKPDGGTICIQSGGAAAANHNERMQGIRDTLGGMSGTTSPGEPLTGENGWTEVDGCPLYTDDDFPRSVQQMEDILARYPDLDAFVPTGGFPQFVPDAYRNVATKVQGPDRQQGSGAGGCRHAAGADGPDEGRALARPGRPAAVRDGLQDDALPLGHQEERQQPRGPDLHRPRRLHARDRRQLHRRLSLGSYDQTASGSARRQSPPSLSLRRPAVRPWGSPGRWPGRRARGCPPSEPAGPARSAPARRRAPRPRPG